MYSESVWEHANLESLREIVSHKACLFHIKLFQFSVFVHKQPPKLLYTGLTKIIGKCRDYGQNLKEKLYFQKSEFEIDLSIPMAETNEYRILKSSEINSESKEDVTLNNLGNMNTSSTNTNTLSSAQKTEVDN